MLQTLKTKVMTTIDLVKGQVYIFSDENRNKRFEVKFINKSKRGYSFRNINAPFMYYFSEAQVESKITLK